MIALIFAALSLGCSQPVWQSGHERAMNENLKFTASFCWDGHDQPVIKVAAANPFRIRLNGKFAGYGPARGPLGWFRLDEWPLEPVPGTNTVEIECAGYYCNSNYFQQQPSFLQAEVVAGERTLARTDSTPGEGVFAAVPIDRVRKINRFTSQRMFAEVYRLPGKPAKAVSLARQPEMKLLRRHTPAPETTLMTDFKAIVRGTFDFDTVSKMPVHPDYNLVAAPKYNYVGFNLEELEYNTWDVVTRIRYRHREELAAPSAKYALKAGEYVRYDSPCNRTGLVGLQVECQKPGELLIMFDEKLKRGEIDPMRNYNANAIVWQISEPGTYDLEGLELVTGKFFQTVVRSGAFVVSAPTLRLYRNPLSRAASFKSSDPVLERIFAAAEETYAQNAVDAFTDCPSRERAGWLCDSFFTARSEQLLTGVQPVEFQFLENYVIPDSFANLPQGMVPMCYPADAPYGKFIPSWSMFLILELDEYQRFRNADRELLERFRPKVAALVNYLDGFSNSDGLLEKLPSWVFVEWSKANRFVQDVNYPNNMVWAAALDAAARLYERPDWAAKARRVREEIRRQSWTGEWFSDNSVRGADGKLRLSGECSEACQNYAFFFGIATPELHPKLYRRFLTEFGPERVKKGLYPKIYKANAFIGNFLRLDWLSQTGHDRQVYEEIRGYLQYMADQTGTLWELVSDGASCCHGYESHAAVFLSRNLVGIRSIDSGKREVVFRPPVDIGLDYCEMSLPTPEGALQLGWQREQGKIVEKISLPAGWKLVGK